MSQERFVVLARDRLMPAPGRAWWRSARFGGASRDSTRRGVLDCTSIVSRRSAAVARDLGGAPGGRPAFGERDERVMSWPPAMRMVSVTAFAGRHSATTGALDVLSGVLGSTPSRGGCR
jgi:hypothetical protein